jgi:DNA-binding MarR family transcriptional regulator
MRTMTTRKSHPDLALVPTIHRATHRIGLYLQSHRPALGVTQAEAHILSHLCHRPPSTIAALHEAFGHRRSTLTSILDRLQERGLVVREGDPTDRRSFVVVLTPKGRRVARRTCAVLGALEGAAVRLAGSKALRDFEAVVSALQQVARHGSRRTGRGAKRATEKRG